MKIKLSFLFIFCAIGFSIIIANLVLRISDKSSNLPKEISFALAHGGIRPAPNDNYLDLLAPTKISRFIVGYTFYNLLFSAKENAAGNRDHIISVNSNYNPKGINIYFIDPDEDKIGILGRYKIDNARSFPEVGIVLVNIGYIKKLLSLQPYVTNLTGESIADIGIQDPKHIGDQTYLKLEKPIDGVDPWQPSELYKTQALIVAMYLTLHEVGHIHDYDKDQKNYYTKSAEQREMAADNFFVDIFSNLASVDVFREIFPTVRSVGTSGMLTLASYQFKKKFNETQGDVFASQNKYILKYSIFASHPPLAFRLMNILYLICDKTNKITGSNYSDAEEYKEILDKISIERSIFP